MNKVVDMTIRLIALCAKGAAMKMIIAVAMLGGFLAGAPVAKADPAPTGVPWTWGDNEDGELGNGTSGWGPTVPCRWRWAV